MPRGVYQRKPRTEQPQTNEPKKAAKKTPRAAKGPRGPYKKSLTVTTTVSGSSLETFSALLAYHDLLIRTFGNDQRSEQIQKNLRRLETLADTFHSAETPTTVEQTAQKTSAPLPAPVTGKAVVPQSPVQFVPSPHV